MAIAKVPVVAMCAITLACATAAPPAPRLSPTPTQPAAPADASAPSLVDTFAWLSTTLTQHGNFTVNGENDAVDGRHYLKNQQVMSAGRSDPSKCIFAWVDNFHFWTWDEGESQKPDENASGDPTMETLHVGDLDVSRIQVTTVAPIDYGMTSIDVPLWRVELPTHGGDGANLQLDSQDAAQRVARGFQQAASLCGAPSRFP